MPSAADVARRAKRIPLRDFFRNPEQATFQLSPDGNSIAFVQPYENRMNVFVRPRAGGPAVRITSETDRDVAGYFWKGSRRIVYLKDFKGDENFHLVSVDSDGKNLVDLTPFDKVRAMIIDDRYDDDGEILVALNKRNPEVFDVYRIDLNSKELTLLAENPGNITAWITDHAGRIRLAIATDGVNNSIMHRADDNCAFATVITTNFRQQISPLFFDFDNKLLFAASNIDRDKAAIVRVDPATAKEESLIFEHPEVDVGGLDWSRKRKVCTEAQFVTWKRERKFFDAEMQAIHADLERQLQGYEIDLQSSNKDETLFVVAAWNDRTQGVRYLYDVATKTLTKLAEIAPWLDENELAEMKPITYQARDGLTIHGYLTLPRGGGKNLPMVVIAHGGPWARDVWGYDPEAQFLANRGYAVMHMNFRGSTGYGRKFWEASFKEWGRTMQDDVTDGVKYAIAQGIADPKRVAIYGGSYGGYCTLAGLAFTPELYACGVDYVGVSNLFTFIKTIPPYWKPMLDMLYEMVGNPETDKELLAAASPALHADNIRAPLLIAQGAQDPRVNIEESNQMVAALNKHGIDVEYIVKDNEGHGFHNEENRFEFYEAMERFLEKHL
ncbi:MAG: S9 family peptidase [Xanthobacteraceae bacterium]|jgi:dipeptidyl aminopeptidase/acylaminoacyl peptidase